MHPNQSSHAHLLNAFPEFTDRSETLETRFKGKRFYGSAKVAREEKRKGFGGWGHPADQNHCMQLLK
jgi:hypothetical protein